MNNKKYVFSFGGGTADGDTQMKNLLGGKGANLAEMSKIGIPVPPGFTISTEVTSLFLEKGASQGIDTIMSEVKRGVKAVEAITGKIYGDGANPLLLSVRSGARVSMPGMMDTVLNLGLNDEIAASMMQSLDPRFVYDCYRRLVQMYGDVVMNAGNSSDSEHNPFEVLIDQLKEEKGVEFDNQLTGDDLKDLTQRFKQHILVTTGQAFPEDPWAQLVGAITSVQSSWHNDRAATYRKLNGIPHDWGTAINVQAMVYGNLNDQSASGVAFTRDAATGENIFNGEYLINAQGEDVVAGIRTPMQVSTSASMQWAQHNEVTEADRMVQYPSLEEIMPDSYRELMAHQAQLEGHYKDMQDLEFTVENGRLWMLQTRSGKRTGQAMVRIAMEMLDEGLIDQKTALLRVDPERLHDLLHPIFDQKELKKAEILATGLPASPGAATGRIVFSANDALQWHNEGHQVILVRLETSPEDIIGMDVAEGILTARGGMTSHAAVVARGMGKCCVSGVVALKVDYEHKSFEIAGQVFKEGDWISLNGTTGHIYKGAIDTVEASLDQGFYRLIHMAQKVARMEVRTNADNPEEARLARDYGARGIGLCRTEHMFFEGERIQHMREMILADDRPARLKALEKLLPHQRQDFEGIFRAMEGLPVTIRLLDPPLHEFLPQSEEAILEAASDLGITVEKVQEKIITLKEINPMLGHRGCRLGITYPEITEMQVRAIAEAALKVKKEGIIVRPEIMVPLIGRLREFVYEENIIRHTMEEIFQEQGERLDYMVGTMIEIPRAAISADLIASKAEFFSFGTNDLTQMTFGFSRDDIDKFLPIYLREGIIDFDPFKRIDENGVGKLVALACEKGKKVRKDIKLGICGEHGGDPASIHFFNKIGLQYVSCSPFRVPVAILATAQATLLSEK